MTIYASLEEFLNANGLSVNAHGTEDGIYQDSLLTDVRLPYARLIMINTDIYFLLAHPTFHS